MMVRILVLGFVASLWLAGCAQGNMMISAQERARQDAADAAVAQWLFERELTDAASYNVRMDGHVVIRFDRSVSVSAYADIVGRLRRDPDIASVYAEQAGTEVCPLR